jgi:hypothetical protein
MEHHSDEVNPHFSKEDLVLGAIDLYEDYVSTSTVAPLRLNSSVIARASDLVKEAAPKLIEVIVNNLSTPSPVNSFDASLPDNNLATSSSTLPDLVMSKLPGTIIVVPSLNTTVSSNAHNNDFADQVDT